jgi:hypothetical protein
LKVAKIKSLTVKSIDKTWHHLKLWWISAFFDIFRFSVPKSDSFKSSLGLCPRGWAISLKCDRNRRKNDLSHRAVLFGLKVFLSLLNPEKSNKSNISKQMHKRTGPDVFPFLKPCWCHIPSYPSSFRELSGSSLS